MNKSFINNSRMKHKNHGPSVPYHNHETGIVFDKEIGLRSQITNGGRHPPIKNHTPVGTESRER